MEVEEEERENCKKVAKPSRVCTDALKIREILFSEPPWENSREGGLIGLKNLGDTCFMNSTLQCLVHCPQLIGLFCSDEFSEDFGGKADLVQSFRKLMNSIWSPTQKAIAPSEVLRDVMKLNEQFQGYQQQDAQELLLCILGNLDDMTQRILKLPPTEEDLKLMKEEEEEEEAREMNEVEKKDRKRHAENSKKQHERNVTQHTDEEEIIDEEPVRKKKKSIPTRKAFRSPIQDIFSGQLQNETECSQCGFVSKVLNSFQDLSLHIPEKDLVDRTIEERNVPTPPRPNLFYTLTNAIGLTQQSMTLDMCLHSFCTSEELIDREQYYCEKCKKKVNAKKVMCIATLPEVLVLHIKRFNYDSGFWGGSKKSTQVEFPESLNMYQYLHPEFQNINENKYTQYELYGLVRHQGSLSGGHYIAYCRSPTSREDWYCFDDRSVYRVSIDKVLQTEAYLLFYSRTQVAKERNQTFAWKLIENAIKKDAEDRDDDVLINSYFFRKLKYFCQVGPLDNQRLLCPHGEILDPEDPRFFHNSLRIPRECWSQIEERFGRPKKGEIPCIPHEFDNENHHTDCIQCKSQKDYKMVSKYMNAAYNRGAHFCIPSVWADKWRAFAKAYPTDKIVPPGAIDTRSIINNEGELLANANYITVNSSIWTYLQRTWGNKGPSVQPPTEEEEDTD